MGTGAGWTWTACVLVAAVAGCVAAPSWPPPTQNGASALHASAGPSSAPTAPLAVAPTSTPAVTTVAGPLTPPMVEARLRVVVPGLALAPWLDDRDVGVFPQLVFRPERVDSSHPPYLNAILVFESTAARQAVRHAFQPMSIQGPRGFVAWDGEVHSEWVQVQNVIVEVVMPGGTFGGRAPTPAEARMPDRVEAALSNG